VTDLMPATRLKLSAKFSKTSPIMKTNPLLLAMVILEAQAIWCPVRADSTSDQIEAMKKQIEALTEKVLSLEKQVAAGKGQPPPAVAIETNMARAVAPESRPALPEEKPEPSKAQISIDDRGFYAYSANSNFVLGLHGHLQIDTRSFVDDGGMNGNSGFLVRRARPIVEGAFFHDFKFFLMPDFGTGANGAVTAPTPQIFDAYLSYSNAPGLRIRAGKFKSPVGLEQLQEDVSTTFNERAFVTDLVPTRDLGLMLHGQWFDEHVEYAIGVFNGVGDYRLSNNSDFTDSKEGAGRLFFLPWKKSDLTALKGLGFGVGGSYGSTSTANGLPNTTGGTLPGYVTSGQQQFFAYNPVAAGGPTPVVVADGIHWRVSPQAYYYYGPFGFMGEYGISDQEVQRTVAAPFTTARLANTAWQITGSWVLTGDTASFKGVNPEHPFHPSTGHWGAVQLVARYGELGIDPDAFPLYADPKTSAHAAQAWAVGFNWYLNRNVRVNGSFSRTTFRGGGGAGSTAPANVTREPENVFFTRFQFGF
jgi:phosphate-selective porin OprO and OprP